MPFRVESYGKQLKGVNLRNRVVIDDQPPNKRVLTDQAIALAVQSKWEEAADLNRKLISFYPQEAEAHNRLGKALTELGQYGAALEAYSQALAADPGNGIARRNIERLKVLAEREAAGTLTAVKNPKMDPRLFVEEAGKTSVTALLQPASAAVLARMNSGDLVRLQPGAGTLRVVDNGNELLGVLETKLGQRIMNYMAKGNQYQAAVMTVDSGEIKIFIRETVQHPSLAGKPTFTPRVDNAHRAYTRDSLFRVDPDEDDEDMEDSDGDYNDRDRGDEEHDDEDSPNIMSELEQSFDIEREEE